MHGVSRNQGDLNLVLKKIPTGQEPDNLKHASSHVQRVIWCILRFGASQATAMERNNKLQYSNRLRGANLPFGSTIARQEKPTPTASPQTGCHKWDMSMP